MNQRKSYPLPAVARIFPVECNECSRLLAIYREAVRMHKETVDGSHGALGADSINPFTRVLKLMEKCRQLSEDFIVHARTHNPTSE